MAAVVHSREEHVLGIFVLILGANHEVGVALISRGFLLTLIYRLALGHHRLAHITLDLESHLRCVGGTVEEGAVTILVAPEIVAEGEDVLWGVLIHRGIGG